MILKGDASKIEWVVKVWQAQDKVAMKEIESGFDIHTDNQKRFQLPNRTIAKNFVYQAIFADAFGDKGFLGPGYSYAKNANYQEASTNPKFWALVLEKFYTKYKGIYSHSISMIKEATTKGKIVAPTGRFYEFAPVMKYGGMDWPRSDILNYPIQGLAADMMALVRMFIYKSIEQYDPLKVLMINTVHDDVELDCANEPQLIYNVCIDLEKAFSNIPNAFEDVYGVKVNTPFSGEVKYGPTLYDPHVGKGGMIKFKKETFFEDFQKLLDRGPL